jgi:hypothetical protein
MLGPLSDPASHEYVNSRFPFAVPALPGAKPLDPPSPAGTAPSLPGSRRQSRILDSGSDFALSVEGEDLMDRWPLDDHEEFAHAMEGLTLTGDGSGKTWEELIDRLLSPGIPSDGMPSSRTLTVDDDFIFLFLIFYRKFAAPSKLLQSLISKFEEASRLAVDYMLQMIAQTRYLRRKTYLDAVMSWDDGYSTIQMISIIPQLTPWRTILSLP